MKSIYRFTAMILLMIFFAFSVSAQCGNNDPKGTDDDGDEGNGCNYFTPYTGNVHRSIKDLEIWGGAGESALVWMRYSNSRRGDFEYVYGTGHYWNGGFYYTMSDAGINEEGADQVSVHYPEGGENIFTRDNTDPDLWLATHGTEKRVLQDGNNFFLQMANGYRYRFEKLSGGGGKTYYQLQDFRDSYQNLYTLSYTNKNLTRITEPAGRHLEIFYTDIDSNTLITKVAASDGRSVNYNYEVFNDGITDWVLLSSVDYGDGTTAVYEYSQSEPGARPNLSHAVDSRYEGPAVNMRYTYDASIAAGFIKEEKNGITDEIMAVLDATTHTVCYPNGRKQVYALPNKSMGQTKSYTDGLGRKTVYKYDQDSIGFTSSTKDALGRITKNDSLTVYGNPLQITYPDKTKEKWTRDDLDLILTHTDALGRVTTYTRDTSHRITRIDYADASFETFTYNGFGKVLDHQKRNGGTEHSEYDSRGLRTNFTDAMGNTMSFTYDTMDLVASKTDALNNTTNFAHNSRGLLINVTNPDGSTRSYTYNSFGNITSVTNELGHVWYTNYDEFRRPVSATDPEGRTTQYMYDLTGGICGCTHINNQPTKVILPSGKIIQMEYDVEWQRISETNGAGSADAATTFFEYDAAGNIATVIDANGNNKTYEYDAMNRRIKATDALGNKTEWTYDKTGNMLTMKRPDNGIITNVYDNMNRLRKTTDARGKVTKKEYDSEGNLIQLTDPENNKNSFQYDLLNRKTKMIYPDGSFESNTYDPAGNIKTYITRAGEIRSFTYDNRNREISSLWSDNTPGVVHTYDAANRVLTITSSVSSLTYNYDNSNLLLSETQNIGGSATGKTISYTYNADKLRSTMTYPDATMISYGYNSRNLTDTISVNSMPPLVTYIYDLIGNRISKTMENNTESFYTYDGDNRMLSIDNQYAGISFARFDYGYDEMSRRKFVKRDNDKGDVFTYDAVDQVTNVLYDVTDPEGLASNAARTVNYEYDGAGNRISLTDNSVSANYSVNKLNQYTIIGDSVLSYNKNGGLEKFIGWVYKYDAQNRLIKATKESTTVTFDYDARNRCVKRTTNGKATFLYYDDWNLTEERNRAGVLLAQYFHGIAMDEMIKKVTTANTVYYHHDALGNTVSLTNTAANVVEKYSYDIYGAATIKDAANNIIAGSAFGNRFMFTGREFIQKIGLYDYRHRMYSPMFGKFLQTDPLRFDAGDYNIYRYVGNNATNYTDPLGLCSDSYLASFWGGLGKLFPDDDYNDYSGSTHHGVRG